MAHAMEIQAGKAGSAAKAAGCRLSAVGCRLSPDGDGEIFRR